MTDKPKPIPLIPKDLIKSDADITALVNEHGYILNCVYATAFAPLIPVNDVVGKHLSELYRPVPGEILSSLERAFEGEAHWTAITLPTPTPVGTIDRRFVVAYETHDNIDGNQVVLVRMKLLSDDITEALEHVGTTQNSLRERANYLISDEFSLNSVYLDALIDVTMRETGFDATILLDEDGVVLDVFSLANTPPAVPEGANFIEFLTSFDPGFQERWDFLLNQWQYINAIEQIPMPGGSDIAMLIRVRVTKLQTPEGKRVVQVFASKLDPGMPDDS